MNGQLYIGGRLADCDAESLALFTYRREDLDNPTVVRNSYTQQIRLKGTPANDAIFGHFAQGTRIAGSSGFDASARTPFTLYANGGEVVESGYAKLDAIERSGRDTAYLVTLYGGLGEILYKLSAADDGSQLTLADLPYEAGGSAYDFGFTVSRSIIKVAWDVLAGTAALPLPQYAEVINFAPCYDGKVEGFAADKFIVPADGSYIVASDGTYSGYNGHVCLKLGAGEVTAQQVGDYRCYLMRPVLKVSAVFEAIARQLTAWGWTLDLDAAFFTAAVPWYADAWMTLPRLLDLGLGQGATATKDALLGGTVSPLSFMVGYCRHFGLAITADHAARRLSIMTRGTYYADTLPVVDLAPRVDLGQQIDIDPLTYDARWFLLGEGEAVGAAVAAYNDKYRTPFGTQRIDTGYAFGDEERDLLEGQPFMAAADVQLTAVGMGQTYAERTTVVPPIPRVADVAATAGTTYELFNNSGDIMTKSLTNTSGLGGLSTGPAMVQLSGADGKAVDGGVLLFFDGMKAVGGASETVWVTDDATPYYNALSGGEKCWHWVSAYGTQVGSLPRFVRRKVSGSAVTASWDFARPLEDFVSGITYPDAATIYAAFWADYMADRYDADARVARVKARLAGLPRPADLLRRLAWWDGALWCINAVQDWDPLTDDTTTIELVRVKDPANYRS